MRAPFRSLATLLLTGVAMCSDAPHAPVKQPGGQARFAFEPVFSREAAAVFAQRATFSAVDFDHVRIAIIRPPEAIIRDTVIAFNPNSAAVSLALSVDVRWIGEAFTGLMEYTNNGVVVYRGQVRLVSYAPDGEAPEPQQVQLAYVGPGANATRLVVAPKTVDLVAPAATSFTATAFDANNGAISNVPLSWSSSDVTIAAVNANGAVTTGGKRGTATITAMTPTGIWDNATVTVALPPALIAVVSGGGQTGKVGTALAQPAVVRVTASDGVGVAGVTVTFSPPSGGSVGSASVTTNVVGQASTTLTLGSTAGAQVFTASVAGFNASIGATATPGEPTTITIVSGDGQQDTVRQALKAPLVVKVADQFGNGVSGVTVLWSQTAGTGALAGPTSVTGADGRATMTYTLGSTIGVETVMASAAGVSGSVTFTATSVAAAPAAITIVSGNNQTSRASQPLPAALVVRVTDSQGIPLPNVPVSWTATNGTLPSGTSTDAFGQSSNTLTLGATVGSATATATVGSGANAKSVTFTATVQPGVARMLYEVPPSTVAAGSIMTPPVMLILFDAAGNTITTPTAVSISLGANPGQAMLSGTLTRVSSNGVVEFTDLRVSNQGTGYTLVASSGAATATSPLFNVTAPPPPYALQFVGQPPGQTPPGGLFSVSVQIVDASGARVLTATNPVTIALGPNSPSGTLSGTRLVAAVNGVATFTGLSINLGGVGYSIVANSGNLLPATSASFIIR